MCMSSVIIIHILINIQQVSVIKARMADELGMPTGKQKLQVGIRIIFPCCMHVRNEV